MEEVYAKILFVELAPDIWVPYEWPVGRCHDVVLSSAKEIIMQNKHEDLVLQVNGIPARLYRHFIENRFYHVFKKISKEDMCGSHVYDITSSDDQNTSRMQHSSGTHSCDHYKLRRQGSRSRDYTISYHYVPHRSRRELLSMNPDDHAMDRRAVRNVKRMSQRTLDEGMSHD